MKSKKDLIFIRNTPNKSNKPCCLFNISSLISEKLTNKAALKTVIIFSLFFVLVMSYPIFFVCQKEVYAQDNVETSIQQHDEKQQTNESTGESSDNSYNNNEIIYSKTRQGYIKEVDTAGYPTVNIYLNFNLKAEDLKGLNNLNLDNVLNNSNFKIIENKKEIKEFKVEQIKQTSEPVGAVLVIDTSGSMKGIPIENAKAAAISFIDRMREIDKTAIVGFSDSTTVYAFFNTDKGRLKKAVEDIKASGETALFDGIVKAIEQFESFKSLKHKYLVVLSDGADTVSKNNIETVISKAKQENIIVYCIGLASKEFNPEVLKEISESNGGYLLLASNAQDLQGLYTILSQQIKSLYKISFLSQSQDLQKINLEIFISKNNISDSFNLTYENPFTSFSSQQSSLIEKNSLSAASLIKLDVWWIKLIIFILTFLSVTLFIYITAIIIIPEKQILQSRTNYYLYSVDDAGLELAQFEKKPKFAFLARFSKKYSKSYSKKGYAGLFDEKLKRAGINITGSRFVLIHIITVILATFLIFLLTKNVFLTLVVILLIIFLPFLFINFRINQKLKKFNEQLPDTLQLIEGALKAGYSLNQSLYMVVKETKPPISEEFTIVLNEIRMGLSEKAALENMAKRINSELFDWVVLAINIQREVGGNLAEIMDIIANTIREKERILRQIRSLTAEGKLSAYVLIGLPIVLGFILSILNRQYISVLFTTRIGFMMLGLAAVLMIIGIIWIIKIIKIEY